MKNGSLSVSDTKLWQRLLLVGLTGAVPLFIVSLVLIKLSYSSSINFAFQEQRGIAFLRPLEQLFDLFQRYQAAARQTLAGDDSAAQKLADLRQQIDKSMDLLAANYNGDLGQALAFTDAELALRKRDNARLSVLQDYWKTLKTASPAVAAGSETTSQLIASIRTMIAQSGNLSNLILDDNLDSYYLMDITVSALPQTQQRLNDITLQVGDWLRNSLAASNKTQIAVLAAMLQQDDLNRITNDAQISLSEDRNFYGLSESLQENLPPAVAKYAAASQPFLALLNRVADGENVTAKEFEMAGWNARTESFRLWQVGVDELDRLLSVRIRAIQSKRLQFYCVIIVTLVLVAGIMGWIIRNLIKTRNIELLKSGEELRASEEKFSKAFLSSPTGIAISELETGRFIEINESFARLYGYSLKEMVGRTSLELGIYRNAEERARMLQLLLPSDSLRELEMQTRTRNGDDRIILNNAELIQLGGKKCIVSMIKDITDQKRVQQEMMWKTAFLEAQVDSSLDGILVVDDRAKRILQNQRLIQLFNVPDHIAKEDDDVLLLQHVAKQTKNPDQFNERVTYLYAHPDEVGRDELALADGRILDRYSAPVRDKAGKYYGRIWTFRDISEQRKLEEQFRQSQKMEGIGQLAGGVAHDFNNILAVIQMQSELLKMSSELTPTQSEFADEIGNTVQRASALTRQLLLFSRREVFQPRDLDLSASISNMTKMLNRILGETVYIQLKMAEQPMFIHADAGMMDQVLLNLTVNARDAMPNGGQLVIETSEVEFDEFAAAQSSSQARPGSFVCLSVSDTGTGIPPEILPKIFEPFFTTKEVGKGTGLGLATLFGIVQQHQGWVGVYSEVGHGTTFRIYLPRLSKNAGPKSSQQAQTIMRGGNETILLAEDDPALRLSVRMALSLLGYRILEAPTGAKAMEVWKQNRDEIRLLLTDMVMPGGMTGKALAEHLLQENPKLKVIYMSGYSAEVVGKDFPLNEDVNFLVKPFQALKLAQTVRNSLDIKTDL